MKMKKALLVIALAASMGVVGLQQASARVHDGKDRGYAASHYRLNDATRQKLDKFRVDTKDLRKQIAMKRAEESALIHSDKTDVEAVKKAAGELFDLKVALQQKFKALDLFPAPGKDSKNTMRAERREKFEKYLADTQDLRKQIFVKRAEERAFMNNSTPDAQAVAKVAGEMFDLRAAMQDKAKADGISGYFYGHGWRGPGMGFDGDFHHHGDFGMMEHPWGNFDGPMAGGCGPDDTL